MKRHIRKRILPTLTLLTFVVVTLFVACGTDSDTSTPGGSEYVHSSLQRELSPAVEATDLEQLVSDNNAFALALYHQLRTEEGNVFFSPFSISIALAMTYAGARGETATEMAEVLHFTLPQDRLHPAFNKLDLELNSRGANVDASEGTGFTLRVVNAIWGQRDKSWLAEFLDTLALNYGAGLFVLDFIADPEQARTTINDWVAEQTEQKIKDLLPQGVITSITRMVLTNAIYFFASWVHPFSEAATQDGAFTLLDGTAITVPMMYQTQEFLYLDGEGFQAVELPYVGSDLSMVILLPDQGEFDNFESSLAAEKLNAIRTALVVTNLNLSLPRFEFEDPTPLTQVLQKMGMTLAFSMEADLSGMDGTTDLFITDVIHKAYVNVNEEGTEAAAATAVVVGEKGIPAEPIDLKIDRPFVFFIRDKTGAILFLGRLLSPKS